MIEVMIVVAIIAILAAIAIPSYLRFQARSKQAEARSILRGLMTAERTYFVAHDTYASSFEIVGFAPEPGNRYSYGFVPGCAVAHQVSARTGVCIGQDAARFPDAPSTLHEPVATVGMFGDDWAATAQGNLDNDEHGDAWVISSADDVPLTDRCATDQTVTKIGDAINTYNDISCP